MSSLLGSDTVGESTSPSGLGSHNAPTAPARREKRPRGGKRLNKWWPHLGSLSLAAGICLLSFWGEAEVATQGNSTESNSSDVEATDPGAQDPGPAQRWSRPEVRVVLDASLKDLGFDPTSYIERAFATWADTGAPLPVITFEAGQGATASLKPDGKSTILVAPIDFEGHETDLAITIGFSNPSNGEISEADIVINSKHVFSEISEKEVRQSGQMAQSELAPLDQDSCSGSLDARACHESYDLQNVLTHEAGHFFGLGENYNDPQATMFSCTSSCEIHKRDLNPADTLQIGELYQDIGEDISSGCSGVQIGGDPRTIRLRGWLVMAMVLTFPWLLLRRQKRALKSL